MDQHKNVPAIRFKGFQEEWTESSLGEIGNTYTGLSGKTKEDFGFGEARFVTYMNVFGNVISDIKKIERVQIDKTQNLVRYGDVLFTTSSETPEEVGMSSVWLHNIDNIYLNSFCFGYRPTIDLNHHYLAYYLRSSPFRKKIIPLAQGISRYNISKSKVMYLNVSLPIEGEQTQIGNFFKNIDEQINLQEQKHHKLVNLKKAMLEKMFPKEGANVPEIRFKGFTEKWEEKKLGDVFGKIKNAFVGTATPFYVNKGHFYLESNNIKDGFINRKTEVFINDYFYLKQKDNWLKTGDIVMVQSGHVGHSAVITKELDNSAAHALIMFSKPLDSVSTIFINYQFYTSSSRKKIDKITTGNTIKHILSSDMKEFEIKFPSLEEQQKIGNYFEQLDTLIQQSQVQIEKYKNIKQALLQKMFV